MKFKVYALFILAGIFSGNAWAQQKEKNPKVKFPDVPGFITLKCDFHMHTVFSDGHVWPSLRVSEAERDGLDAISITEHTDYEGYAKDINRDRERAFEIAAEMALKTHVLVIRGVEISPRVAPYHNNAIFLQNVNKFPFDYMKQSEGKFVMKDNIKKSELMAPFLEAQKQNAFVFYNHPSYGWWDKKNRNLFTEFHEELLTKGILGGVEVVNGQHYNIIAHQIAEKYNLTLIANSDAHKGINTGNPHRPMTLVFAKDKSEAAIKEALINRRTALYTGDFIIGRQAEVEALFKASLDVKVVKKTARNTQQLQVKITNNSAVPYAVNIRADYLIDGLPLGKITLKAHEETTILLNPVWEYPAKLTLQMEVSNVLVSSEKCLQTAIVVQVKE